MRLILSLVLILAFLFLGCNKTSEQHTAPAPELSVKDIINKSIARHGGDIISKSDISFKFRNHNYRSIRNGGQFTYERSTTDSIGRQVRDILKNDGFYRLIDEKKAAISPKDSAAYSNSVNSVLYFALLPYFLKDPSANTALLGEASFQGQDYYKIKVFFQQEGGGKDFEDEFVYWINKNSFTLDFLAYNFLVDGGGARFRKATNVREVNGVRFADFINYAPEPDSREVAVFDSLYDSHQMKELSIIALENIEVNVLNQ